MNKSKPGSGLHLHVSYFQPLSYPCIVVDKPASPLVETQFWNESQANAAQVIPDSGLVRCAVERLPQASAALSLALISLVLPPSAVPEATNSILPVNIPATTFWTGLIDPPSSLSVRDLPGMGTVITLKFSHVGLLPRQHSITQIQGNCTT